MGLGAGAAGQGHQGPWLWPSPQHSTGALTDLGAEGCAESTWAGAGLAVPCLIPATALLPLPILVVLGSTGAAAGTGNGLHKARMGTVPLGDVAHSMRWAEHHGAHPGAEQAGGFASLPYPSCGTGALPRSDAAIAEGCKAGTGPTLLLPAPNRKQAPGPASTSAPDLLAGASGAMRDGSGWGCCRG